MASRTVCEEIRSIAAETRYPGPRAPRSENSPARPPKVPFWKRKLFPRWSLRTQLIVAILIGSIMGLYWQWEPWVLEWTADSYYCQYPADFTPDGEMVYSPTAGDTVTFWDASTGQRRYELRWKRGDVFWLTFSPDGRHMAATDCERYSYVWNVKTGARQAVLLGGISQGAFSPDGSRIATAAPGSVAMVWHSADGALDLVLRGHTSGVTTARFSADGLRIITAGDFGVPRIWDARDGTPLCALESKTYHYQVPSARFLHEDQWAVGLAEGSIWIWDANDGRELAHMRKDHCVSVEFSSDGWRVLAAGFNDRAVVWDLRDGARASIPINCCGMFSMHPPKALAVFSSDGHRLVTSNPDGTARVWDAECLSEIAWLDCGEARTVDAAFSPDGRRLVTGDNAGNVHVWDTNHYNQVATMTICEHGWDTCVRYSPDCHRIVACCRQGGRIAVWHHQRPESVPGIISLPAFWLAAICVIALPWSLLRDRKVLSAGSNPKEK